MFAVSGLSTILCQTRVTRWCKARMAAGRALAWGLLTMGLAFVPLLAATAVPVPAGGSVAGPSRPSRRRSVRCCSPSAR